MKTRIGFVSNSSTTSFAIYGCHIGGHSKEIMEATKKMLLKSISPNAAPYRARDEYDEDISYQTEELAYLIKLALPMLNVWCPNDNGVVYVGRQLWDMKENETKKKFMDDISKKIKIIFGDSVTCGYHQEAWYNG